MDTMKKINIMQAYVDGKTIQIWSAQRQEWRDDSFPTWNWDYNCYRIKPEPFSCFAMIDDEGDIVDTFDEEDARKRLYALGQDKLPRYRNARVIRIVEDTEWKWVIK